jgi:hypothetical protein
MSAITLPASLTIRKDGSKLFCDFARRCFGGPRTAAQPMPTGASDGADFVADFGANYLFTSSVLT